MPMQMILAARKNKIVFCGVVTAKIWVAVGIQTNFNKNPKKVAGITAVPMEKPMDVILGYIKEYVLIEKTLEIIDVKLRVPIEVKKPLEK